MSMQLGRVRVDAPKAQPAKQSISLSDIRQRTASAVKLEGLFKGMKPGQKIVNADVYLKKLATLNDQATQDYQKLFNPNTKVTEPIKKARTALQEQIIALKKANVAAQLANITGDASQKSVSAAGIFPSQEQLRDNKDTPLHRAVRNQDLRTAILTRYEMRLNRLGALCQLYARTVKDPKTTEILKKPDFFVKLIPAVEKLHVLSFRPLDSKALQKHFKDPDVVKVLQDPDFRKMIKDPNSQGLLNGLDVLMDLDSQGISPLDEAVLQRNTVMTNCLLFPHLALNQELKEIFWTHINELKGKIDSMRRVDPNTLPDVCKAAYLGHIDQLMQETDFNTKDKKGLTPLHYAILGKKIECIQHLLDRTDLYALTPEGHSYLDYAFLSGHGRLVNLFENLNLPFRLGEPQEKFSYSLASGLIEQSLAARASFIDPVARGAKDQDYLGINMNAVWAGTSLAHMALGLDPTVRLGWLNNEIKSTSHAFNRSQVGIGQVIRLLPPWLARPAEKTVQIYIASLLPTFALTILGRFAAYMANYDLTQITNSSSIAALSSASDVAGKVFSVARFLGAAKPVIDRLPLYYNAARSRPLPVMKAIAWDAFNIGTQALMTDYSILYSAKSRFFG